MKLQIILIAFLSIINSININTSKPSQETLSLQDFLNSSSSWKIYVSTSTFKKPILKLTDSTDASSSEQIFPICPEEEATKISDSLSGSFRGLPCGYQDCLRTILTGKNEQEILSLTQVSGTILDKDKKNRNISNLRKQNPSTPRQ